MATAAGPQPVTEPASLAVSMTFEDSVAREQHHLVSIQPPMTLVNMDGLIPQAAISTPQHSPRGNLPPPNPPFVFPARPSSSSAPSSYSRASGRRPRSAIEGSERPFGAMGGALAGGDAATMATGETTPSLPAFVFNPGAGLSPEPATTPRLLSPPLSPQSPRATPARPVGAGHGHRRGGSEFVGGNIRSGDAVTASTSPTKSESGFASPTFPPLPQPVGAAGTSAGASAGVGAVAVIGAGMGGGPKPPGLGPVPGRRGHAHRRSAALSGVDLTVILQPTSPNNPQVMRGSSAPTSPAEFEHKGRPFFDPMDEPLKLDTSVATVAPASASTSGSSAAAGTATPPEKEPAADDEKTPTKTQPSPVKAIARARVGFSDTLEFIPRPLSLVSSDTSSTITVRPGHSVSGSISSVVSANNHAIIEREIASGSSINGNNNNLAVSPRKRAESRPRTAGAVMERTQNTPELEQTPSPRRRNSIPHLVPATEAEAEAETEAEGSAANPSPTKTPKRWSFFGLEPFSGTVSPTRSRPASSSSSETPTNADSATRSSVEQAPDCVVADVTSAFPRHMGKKKKQKRVRAWAGSILTRKSKARGQKNKAAGVRRSQTPPPAMPSYDNSLSPESGVDELPSHLAPPTLLITESSTPPRNVGGLDDDASFPVIDLDAALGPFNTPLPQNPEWEAAQRAGAPHKRQLHSAAGLRGFAGPGMHYHRRAESAPEMVPFEGGRFGIHRLGSNSTMADVFEEDEEDEDDTNGEPSRAASDAGTSSDHPASLKGTAVDSVMDDSAAGSVQHSKPPSVRSMVTDSDADDARAHQPSTTSVRSQQSASSLHDEIIVEEELPYFAGSSGPDIIYTRGGGFDASDSAAPSPRHVPAPKELLPPVDVSLQLPGSAMTTLPVSPHSTSQSSAFPSPRSPASYERVSTAPSSYTDENNFQSLLLGEPGPELRVSVDGVPSLTSSNSTMTRESVFGHNQQGQQYPAQQQGQQQQQHPGVVPRGGPFQSQRPSSVTSAAFSRRRSSLASLSRLISSSHGERSKLSMEVPFDAEPDGRQKPSKTKRLSRMMQFWKPKESGNNRTE